MASTVSKLFKEVERLRVELGVSIDEAAGYVGVKTLTYSKWRRFWNNPSANQEDGLGGAKAMFEYAKHHGMLPVYETNPRIAKGLRLDILRRIRSSM